MSGITLSCINFQEKLVDTKDTGAIKFIKSKICAKICALVAVPLAALFEAFRNLAHSALCISIVATRKVVNLVYETNFLANFSYEKSQELYDNGTAFLALASTGGLGFWKPSVQRSVGIWDLHLFDGPNSTSAEAGTDPISPL